MWKILQPSAAQLWLLARRAVVSRSTAPQLQALKSACSSCPVGHQLRLSYTLSAAPTWLPAGRDYACSLGEQPPWRGPSEAATAQGPSLLPEPLPLWQQQNQQSRQPSAARRGSPSTTFPCSCTLNRDPFNDLKGSSRGYPEAQGSSLFCTRKPPGVTASTTGSFTLPALRPRSRWGAAVVSDAGHGLSHRRQAFAATASPPRVGKGEDGAHAEMLVVQPGYSRRSEAALQEALRLAETLTGEACPHLTLGAHSVKAATYIGKGGVVRVAEEAKSRGSNQVFVNAVLNAVQQRNLEAAFKCTVLDRVAVIINIFSTRALTREARLQVQLAELEFKASRLVRGLNTSGERATFADGMEVVSARERGRGSSASGGLGGAAGGGESELRLQKHRINRQRKALQLRLAEVQRSRSQQRRNRKRSGTLTAAVVGYTNAGKSSLVAALTHRNAEAADQLFATLDPLLARCQLPSGRSIVLSDTVGFISNLPHQLVDAFRSTLEEVVEAELLVHVIDASSPVAAQQRQAVIAVLHELGLTDEQLSQRVVEVWNKVDVLDSHVGEREEEEEEAMTEDAGDAVGNVGELMPDRGDGDHREDDSGGTGSEGLAASGEEGEREEEGAAVLSEGLPLAQWSSSSEALRHQMELSSEGREMKPTRILTSVATGKGLRELCGLLDRMAGEASGKGSSNQNDEAGERSPSRFRPRAQQPPHPLTEGTESQSRHELLLQRAVRKG
mmetsp:Transcript_22593/g.62726  ORF Transcript_22593/g.62726 Transcript_22593/m.62726 type:complete len:729 (+) Transcript_22593:244-2430(+)|eukprot:CAMPEP_0117651314 /NCGR_PEP_ID=MMETSP0804-20121206/2025_1 /TAXON_ID=1074897 /ORGANISM="Tetraselmis astigmatica, Strain CCMP880" /LENGTH=728 /DNA_ID=CAMNT_0005457281 /DNA_START=159 /DNA_END=2345 /DNA_ORIENTATION=+